MISGITATTIEQNTQSLQKEIQWFKSVLDLRIRQFLGQEVGYQSIYELQPPDLENDASMYAQIVRHFDFGMAERLLLMLSFTPHIYPEILDIFLIRNESLQRGFTEFGGILGKNHGGFLPTGETAIFLLSEGRLEKRLEAMRFFDDAHPFHRHHILSLETSSNDDEPTLSGLLKLSEEYLHYFTSGKAYHPNYNAHFPAKRINTSLNFEDLICSPAVMEQLNEIKGWIKHGDTLMNNWGLKEKIKPGYRCLFYGPPGTGKTLSATLIGKACKIDVYRIDLSMVVSKYIGETEKNLANVFDQAENKKWILFFDEADALFGKRTETRDANDRHANQQVAYLLQRVEDFPGVVILSTNLKKNLDEAFARRFNQMIYFPIPNAAQRLSLWQNNFTSPHFQLEDEAILEEMAEKYELTGGNIINILRYCCIKAIMHNKRSITRKDLFQGIRKEFNQMGKIL